MTFEFAGFIIGNDKAEFAAQYESKLCTCEWVPTPEFASTFTTARQANNAIKKLGNPFRLWVLKLLDCGDRFIVTTDEKDQPPWFEKLR